MLEIYCIFRNIFMCKIQLNLIKCRFVHALECIFVYPGMSPSIINSHLFTRFIARNPRLATTSPTLTDSQLVKEHIYLGGIECPKQFSPVCSQIVWIRIPVLTYAVLLVSREISMQQLQSHT